MTKQKQEMGSNASSPYFYKIRHLPSGRVYVGAQYGKCAHPLNIWSTYFTSSKHVKDLVRETGVSSFVVVYAKQRNDAREFETRYLRRMCKVLGKDRFCELFINRNLSPGILLSAEQVTLANGISKRKKMSELAKKRVKDGTHNFITDPYTFTKEQRAANSVRMLGNDFGKRRVVDTDLRALLSEKSRGNTNVRGLKWWTNGVIFKRSKSSPGEEFYRGGPSKTLSKRKANVAV